MPTQHEQGIELPRYIKINFNDSFAWNAIKDVGPLRAPIIRSICLMVLVRTVKVFISIFVEILQILS